ncbi:uncharacterized protein F4807DRAFT_427868 [Annulohypoxylon truncatum]|uniref:uncharacterized protein n=1 Tax=Annulohypoxylon truncatum TaxID=327061 RepID=UPI0020079FDC|nr:uncharacterized protein F4807DRAFT_427868 [Annulohypoxylon truncatum]KAI1209289.1 hypothetical protein F4807DRAFT_427868 [Annulohypoxylon truncatum]
MAPPRRFIVNDDETPRTVDANRELLASLDRITTHWPPVHTCSTGWKFQGFYNGPTSIAYLFYRLSQIFPDMEFKQQTLLDWSVAYLALGAHRTKKEPYSTDCGITNETLAHLSLSAIMDQNTNLVREICSFDQDCNDRHLTGSDEWMYGRAGYLYFLRLCKTLVNDIETPESSTATLLDKTIQNTMVRILANSPTHYWHGKEYFGAAHGTVGMVTQLMLSHRLISFGVHTILERVLDRQCPSGNFPPTARTQYEDFELPPEDHLVQFCHGAPGIIIALRSLLPHFPNNAAAMRDRVEAAMEEAEKDVWKRGLLTKNPCLCHGIAGNALALSRDNHERFLHFLSWMSTEELENRGWLEEEKRADRAAGLYTGEAGRAWAWAIAVSNGPRVLIGFNDL